MHRIDGPGSLPGNVFREGDPTLGVVATTVTADFMNAVQEELASVINAASLALAKPDNTQLLQAIVVLMGAAVPPSAVQAFARGTAPAGWLACDGSTVSRATYAALFAAIGTTFNTGGEAGTVFRLPDLRGEFVRGWDAGRGVDAARVLGTAQGHALGAHTHGIDAAIASYDNASNTAVVLESSGSGASDTADRVTRSAGGTETRPRNVAMLYCIKY